MVKTSKLSLAAALSLGMSPYLHSSDMGAVPFYLAATALEIHGGGRVPINNEREIGRSPGWEWGLDFNGAQFTDTNWTLRPTVTFSKQQGSRETLNGSEPIELNAWQIGLDFRYYFNRSKKGLGLPQSLFLSLSLNSAHTTYDVPQLFAQTNNVPVRSSTSGMSYAIGMGYQVSQSVGIESRFNSIPRATFGVKKRDSSISISVYFRPFGLFE